YTDPWAWPPAVRHKPWRDAAASPLQQEESLPLPQARARADPYRRGRFPWTWSAYFLVSVVTQANRLTHIAHGFLRKLAGLLAAIGDDIAHQGRILLVHARTLAHRLLLLQHALDHRLLAFDTANTGAATALLYPGLHLVVRIDLMQLPHRALVRIARIG